MLRLGQAATKSSVRALQWRAVPGQRLLSQFGGRRGRNQAPAALHKTILSAITGETKSPEPPALSSQDAQLFQQSQEEVNASNQRNDFLGIVQLLGLATGSSYSAYLLYPGLVDWVSQTWSLNSDSAGNYENSLFSLVGIVYGLLVGNSFLVLYDRQVNIVQELYGEAFALEILLQHVFLTIPEQSLRIAMAERIREYIREELYDPVEMTSPFAPDSPFIGIVHVALEEQKRGSDVSGLLDSIQKLADAQSRRSAVAAQVLPALHNMFLVCLALILVSCFLVFAASAQEDSTSVGTIVERQLAFSALVGVLVLTQTMLFDLENPIDGLYSFKKSLDARLVYVFSLLSQLERGGDSYVPEELQKLQQFGLVSSMSGSTENPSTRPPKRSAQQGRIHSGHGYPGGPLQLWKESE